MGSFAALLSLLRPVPEYDRFSRLPAVFDSISMHSVREPNSYSQDANPSGKHPGWVERTMVAITVDLKTKGVALRGSHCCNVQLS